MKEISSQDITFVVQGNIRKEIRECVASIRRFFPCSPVILSTWAGTDISDVDCDEAVFSIDPGDCGDVFFPGNPMGLSRPNNLNRQIISSFNGLQIVKTRYAVKFRPDFILTSDAIGRKYADYASRDIPRALRWSMFEHRIGMCAPCNPRTTSLSFHLCDYIAIGHTKDLIELYNIPLQTLEEAQYCVLHNLDHPQRHRTYRYACEQELWLRNLDKFRIIYKKPSIYYEANEEIIRDTERSFYNNLYFFDYRECGLISKFSFLLTEKGSTWAYKERDYQKWIAEDES